MRLRKRGTTDQRALEPGERQDALGLLLALWREFPAPSALELFTEHAFVELPFPLVEGLPRRLNGLADIKRAAAALLAKDPAFKFPGELRSVVHVPNEAVVEYFRKGSDARVVGGPRLLVWLLEQDGLVAGVRIMFERNRRKIWKSSTLERSIR